MEEEYTQYQVYMSIQCISTENTLDEYIQILYYLKLKYGLEEVGSGLLL